MNKRDVIELFRYARSSIASRFSNESFKELRIPEVLREKHGVFVTLTLNNELRGCIGIINPVPLWRGVIDASRSSAFSDPRFPPLSESEFSKVLVEISILSVPVKSSLDKVVKGDGLIISLNGRSALFLPQVWDELSDKEEFLAELCIKAGLEPLSYKNKRMVFETFSVEAWKENAPKGDIIKVM